VKVSHSFFIVENAALVRFFVIFEQISRNDADQLRKKCFLMNQQLTFDVRIKFSPAPHMMFYVSGELFTTSSTLEKKRRLHSTHQSIFIATNVTHW
jgi:hypothetical protein